MPLLVVSLVSLLAIATSTAPAVQTTVQQPTTAQAAPPAIGSSADGSHRQNAFEDYRSGIERSLRESASPRDWALSTQTIGMHRAYFDAPLVQARGALLRKAAGAAPQDRLVQRLWANAPPENSGCNAQQPCPDRAAALARIDPDNGFAWVTVVAAAWNVEGHVGTDSALARMAAAKRFDDMRVEAVFAWDEVYRRYPFPHDALPARLASLNQGAEHLMAIAAAGMMQDYSALEEACDRKKNPNASAARFVNCGRIGRLMLTHANTHYAVLTGMDFLRISKTADADDLAAATVVDWQDEQYNQRVQSLVEPAELITNFAELERTRSEVEARQLQLRRIGAPLTPPPGWEPTLFGRRITPLGGSLEDAQ